MGLQAIKATREDGKPVFLVDQDIGEMTVAHRAVRQGVSFQTKGASIVFSATHRLLGPKMGEGLRRVFGRASVVAEMCVLWLLIGAMWDYGLCDENKTRAQAVVAPTEKGPKIAQPNAMPDQSLLVSQVVETTVIEQKQSLERGRERVDVVPGRLTRIQQLHETQRKAAQAPRSAAAWEFGAARIVGLETVQAAEAETKQRQAPDQERDRTDTFERELSSLRAEVDSAWIAGSEAVDAFEGALSSLRAELNAARKAGLQVVQAAEAEIKQKQTLRQERERAEALVRELSIVRAKLDAAAPSVGPEVAQAAAAEQKQALKQARDRGEALARDLTSLRAELDTARAAGLEAARTAEATKIEQDRAVGKEREKTETLARELAAARKEVEERSALLAAAHAEALRVTQTNSAIAAEQKLALARELASARKGLEERSALLAAAHAEVLQVTETNNAIAAEQKLALAQEHDRADALARELTSTRSELEVANRQIAASNSPGAVCLREQAADGSQERAAEPSSRTIEGKQRSPVRISVEAVASSSGRASALELLRPEPRPTAREAASDLDPKVAMATERSAPTSTASRSLVDEQRLLARANALLLQADISGARPLLEHALERGSARAAFMLAETYDARVLQSWGARGIPGDLVKAREFYEWAQAGGIEDAKQRIKTLK